MIRQLRALLMLPALILALVITLVVLPSAALSNGRMSPETVSAAYGVSPLPTADRGGTVP
jgi:hypothetical protein